jgi:hypothetical protein
MLFPIVCALTSSVPLHQFLSDGLDVEADFNQLGVIQDLPAVEDEGRLLHGRVDAVVVESSKKKEQLLEKIS